MKTKEITSVCPSTKKEWRLWLQENHLIQDAVWLIMYKKNSETPTITWSDAVDEALCFGWIDSVKKPIDAEKYMQYFGKRKAGSTWSKINKNKVETLMAQGLIAEAGFRSIEIAKQNGTWTILDSVESFIIPEDLEIEFDKHPHAKAYFLGFSKSKQKSLLQWLVLAKRPETRQNRVKEIADCAAKNCKPKQFQ